eukprot:768606-Hanusia_phi.AAC.2
MELGLRHVQALAVCVEEGHGAKIARVLLEHGANPDGRDSADVPIAFYALLRQVSQCDARDCGTCGVVLTEMGMMGMMGMEMEMMEVEMAKIMMTVSWNGGR